MMEAAESSSSDVIWAKLVPSDSKYSDIEIRSNEFVICSAILSSSLENRKWCKITRNSDKCSATMQNISSNAILVDEAVIQKEDEIIINCGSEIIPGPGKEGYLNYRFKVMPPPESRTQQVKVCINAEHAKCSICLNIWHDAVTVGPCLHSFCNGCFSEWLRRSQEKRANVLCPHCRAVVLFVGRNHFLHNIEEDILQADSSLRRSDEEIALVDSSASIKSNLVIQNGKKIKRKRAFSMLDVESVREELMCPQCGTEQFGGFRCDQNTAHLQCQACGGMMPARTDIGVPQHCLGCDRTFCGAYWRAQGVTGSDSHMVCSHENFKPISQRTLSRIPFLAHEKNRHEQDITASCISEMGKTLQDVISDWIGMFNRRELDRTKLELNNAEIITGGTYVCNDCYDKVVSFLLYWIRISMPKHYLSPEARKREDCWYGYSCRTQHHNEEHARRRNHVCRPTRGSHTSR